MLVDLLLELQRCVSLNDEKGTKKVLKSLEYLGMDKATAMSFIKKGAKEWVR